MRNKFKRGESVIVNGIGKNNKQLYRNKRGSVLDKDEFYHDYSVKFSKKEIDWFDEWQLKKIRSYKERKKVI